MPNSSDRAATSPPTCRSRWACTRATGWRIMMPNLLQYPVALFGVLRAGLVVVNVNPQYTVPANWSTSSRTRAPSAIVVLENFAHTLQEVLERNPTLQPGRHHDRGRRHVSGGQGASHQRRGEVREAHGARMEDCGRNRIQRGVACGAWAGPGRRAAEPRRHGLPAVHGRHDRRGQGRRADARQPGGERAADGGLDGARPGGRQGGVRLPVAAVSRLRADLLSRVPEDGRTHRAGDQPEGHEGLHPRPEEGTPSRSSSASIRCTARCSMRPSSRTWTRAP